MGEDLPTMVKRFFEYLETVELSDGGKEYHPIQIICTSIALQMRLSALLECMKEEANRED
jgi:hypothetical protein